MEYASYEVIDDLIYMVNTFNVMSDFPFASRYKSDIFDKIDKNMISLLYQRYDSVLDFLVRVKIIVQDERRSGTVYYFTTEGFILSQKTHREMNKQFGEIIDSFNNRDRGKVVFKIPIESRFEILDI